MSELREKDASNASPRMHSRRLSRNLISDCVFDPSALSLAVGLGSLFWPWLTPTILGLCFSGMRLGLGFPLSAADQPTMLASRN